MRNPRTWAWLMVVFAASYAGLAIWRGWFLLTSGNLTQTVFGLAIITIPLLGMWLIWRELDFGFAMQRMGRDMAEHGALPVESGRLHRDEATERVQVAQQAVDTDPDDWRAWYLLGIAQDQAHQRKLARAAMREALARSPYAR